MDPVSIAIVVGIIVSAVAAVFAALIESVLAGLGGAVPGDRSHRSDTVLGMVLIAAFRRLNEEQDAREDASYSGSCRRRPVGEMSDDEIVDDVFGNR